MSKREFRTVSQGTKADGNTLSGYIAVFNSLSEDLGGFREQLAPGCFTSSMGSEIRALINHNSSACIGNTKSGTLRLKQDDKGLAFECELPDTTAARDLKVSVERGDVTGCSFGFYCKDDDWEKRNGEQIRTVKDVELFEVSCGVTFPAYTDTSSQLRSMFPDGQIEVPAEKRDVEPNASGCECQCSQCVDNDCEGCSDPDCTDANCSAERSKKFTAKVHEQRVKVQRALLSE